MSESKRIVICLDGTWQSVQPVNINAVFTLPVDWIMDFTVTPADGVTVTQLTVTVEDNEPVVFTDLSSGAQVTFDSHVGEFEVCWTVQATTEPGPNRRLEVEMISTPSYGSGSSSRSWIYCSEEITLHRCKTVRPQPRIEYPDP